VSLCFGVACVSKSSSKEFLGHDSRVMTVPSRESFTEGSLRGFFCFDFFSKQFFPSLNRKIVVSSRYKPPLLHPRVREPGAQYAP
jgi:hypothetical protein